MYQFEISNQLFYMAFCGFLAFCGLNETLINKNEEKCTPEIFYSIAVLKKQEKYRAKHLQRSRILVKLRRGPITLAKTELYSGNFFELRKNFKDFLFA